MTPTQVSPAEAGDTPMTGAELRILSEFLGLRQCDVAHICQVSERTVRHWLADTYAIPDGVRDELREIEASTERFVTAVYHRLIEDGPGDDGKYRVMTYRNDATYLRHHPDADMPAGWHRAAMGRVARRLPGLRLHYIGEDEGR